MKKVILTIWFLGLIYCSSAMAADKTFSSNGQILSGETWNNVNIQNNDTVVDMSGGQINSLTTRDLSFFNMSGGQINKNIEAYSGSTVNIYDGTVDLTLGEFVVEGNHTSTSHLNIMGGNVTAGYLKAYPTSDIEFTGGILNFDLIYIAGELTIKGGFLKVDDVLIEYGPDPATVNIYGYGFNYNPTGGNLGEGLLTGYLQDNNFFSIDGLGESGFQRFNLIPEPTTLAFFAFGSLVLIRGRQR